MTETTTARPEPATVIIDGVTVRDTGDPKAARLAALLERLTTNNPFVSEFTEYAARLDTGAKATEQFATPAARQKQEAALRLAASAAGPLNAEAFYLDLAGRVALTSKWYDALTARGAELACLPSLVPYVDDGIPAPVAAQFFALSVPPVRAVELYRMIYADAGPLDPAYKVAGSPADAPGAAKPGKLSPMVIPARRKGKEGRRNRKQ